MLRTLGILLVVCGASGAGFSMALGVRRTVDLLQQLLGALETMASEIACRQTPLPRLMAQLETQCCGPAAGFFGRVARELSRREEPSVAVIFRRQVAAAAAFPSPVRQTLLQLGNGLGQYDVPSQLRAVELAAQRLRSLLDQCREQQQARVRSYCTLGVCAGLAIAILAV